MVVVFYFGLPKLLIKNGFVRAEVPASESELELYGMDWFPPEVGIKDPKRSLDYATSEFSLSSTEKLEVDTIPEGWQLLGESQFEDIYYYVLATNLVKDGKHNVSLAFKDSNGNVTTREVELNARSDRSTITEWEKFSYTAYPYQILSLVSKSYKLPQDFIPPDLVSLGSLGITNNNSAQLRKDAAKALQEMTSAISAAGIDYTVTSAYRSYSSQVSAYGYWLGYYAGDVHATDLVSARPGFSEHQLGNTIDFVTSANNNIFSGFQFTPLSNWLAENAYKYGFALSYPEGKTDITGYTFEPWHYRFIGKQNAKDFKSSGLTLIEWLEKQSSK